MLLAEKDREVGVRDGVKYLVNVWSHVTLLKQRCPKGGALGPFGNLLLRIILVVGVCPGVKILKTLKSISCVKNPKIRYSTRQLTIILLSHGRLRRKLMSGRSDIVARGTDL